MKFPGFERKNNAQLSEKEIEELLRTANNEGETHERPGHEPIAVEQTTYRDGNTWKDEIKKEVRYEDN